MSMKTKILPNSDQRDELTVNPRFLLNLGIPYRQKIFIRFGNVAYEVTVNQSVQLEVNEFLLSENVLTFLRLPTFINFQIIYRDGELHLGPFIGILAAKTKDRLDDIYQYLTNYVYDYDSIGGAVVTFSIEGIDINQQTITGYIYNPVLKEWQPGTFNYPNSIFKREGFGKELRTHFQSILGNRVFNSYIFNKWEMHEWLERFPIIKAHLPETILYERPKDIYWFLDMYQKAYIKPIYGSQGADIIEATRTKAGDLFRYRKDGKNHDVLCIDKKESNQFLRETLKNHQYIIQEAIDIFSLKGALIDFRILLVKNYSGLWEDMGMVSRYGEVESIVSNVSSGGLAEKAELTLKKAFKLSDEDALRLRKEMSTVAINAAKYIEECGVHCGNLGIDMALDTKKKIWIIEMNNKDPNHTISIDAGDRNMFYHTKLANMLYAKRLAGF
jgi:hypothetical protein